MLDKVFGEMEFDCGFVSQKTIVWGEEALQIEVRVDCDEGVEISQAQRDAYEALMLHWDEMQHKIALAILKYYNEEERGAYGPDDPDEFEAWWPVIESTEELITNIHPDSIVIPSDYIMENRGKGAVYVLFDRDWGGEDTEDNGVAVFIEDGEVSEVGYKYIAF